jgi:hypothetical protein
MRLSEILSESWLGLGGKKDPKRLHDTARSTTSRPTFRLSNPLIQHQVRVVVGRTIGGITSPAGWPELRQQNCPPPEGRRAFCSSALGRR